MTDNPSSGGSVTPTPETPVNGTPAQSGVTPATTPTLTVEELSKRNADLERSLNNAKEENDRHSKRLSTYEKQEKERLAAEQAAKDAQLSEIERVKKQAADAEKARDEALRAQQELRVSNAVTLAAGRLNFNDPDDGMRYIKTADLEDDLSNVGDLLKQVLKERPYLQAGKGQTVQTSGGATNPSRSQSTAPQALSWDVISRMNPQEYEARRGEIQKYIAEHPFRYGQR